MFYVFYLSPLALNTPIPAKWNIYLDIDSTWWNICLHNSFRRGTAALIYHDFHPNTLSWFNFRHQNVYSNDYIEQTKYKRECETKSWHNLTIISAL
jgi:hypothetical protein